MYVGCSQFPKSGYKCINGHAQQPTRNPYMADPAVPGPLSSNFEKCQWCHASFTHASKLKQHQSSQACRYKPVTTNNTLFKYMSVVDSSTVAARPSMKRTVAAVVSTDGAEYDPGMDHIEKAPRIDDEVFDCAGLAPPEIKDFNLNYPYMLDQVGGKNLPWKVVGSSLISHECLKLLVVLIPRAILA